MFTCLICPCDLGGDGPTIAIKDTIDIAGLPTQAGSRALAEVPPAGAHAGVVAALLAAGWRIVGKTVLHEFAFGVTGVNAWAGTPVNPHFPHLIPGGSSSGSASIVAAGQVDAALGTDTGGSIRMPAACCGIYGLKPTFGRIDRQGVLPARTSLDCVGPMAPDMDRLIAVMAALEPGFTPCVPAGLLRLGLVSVQATAPVVTAVAAAAQGFAAAGAGQVTPVTLPSMEAAFAAGLTIINAETWAACGAYLARGKVGADVAARLEKAGQTTAEAVATAEDVRTRFTAEVDAALAGLDALILPTLPGAPQTLADALAGKMDLRATSLIRPFNLSGHPALTLPLPAVDGAPVALQIVGRKGEDEMVCGIGRHLASLLPVPNP